MGSKVARITCGFLIATSIYFNAPNRAFAGAAIGATEPTQLLNNIQLVVSYIEQLTTAAENVQQTFMEAENRVRDVAMPFFDAKNRLDNVRDVVKDGLSLAYSVQNLDQVFLDRYKSFDDFMVGYENIDFAQDIRKWTQTTEDSISNALQAAGIQMESLEDEENIMNQLYARAENATGRQRALDIANEISTISVRQMQSLRQLVATDMQIKAAYFQQETAVRKATSAGKEEYYNSTVIADDPPPLGDGANHGFMTTLPAGIDNPWQ